jgi:hypothetical protein
MKTRILKLNNEERSSIYCLVNMSTAEDYKKIAEILRTQFHAKFIEQLGVIWVYAEKYEYQGKFFLLVFHDDLECCYFEAVDKNSSSEDETWLVGLIESVVEKIT